GKLKTQQPTLTPKELEELVAAVQKQGDAARGEAIFRRKDLGCLKCHAIAGSGGQVGPDLTSIGASAPVDYLVESVLLPSKAIKENYHAVKVTLLSGRVVTGIKVRETKTELVVRTAEDQLTTIAVKDIDDQEPSKTSLMPEGLEEALTRPEV